MILEKFTYKNYVYLEGSTPNCLYFIKEGKVELTKDRTIINKKKISLLPF